MKRKSNGSVNKFKTSLVAKGFLQVYELDYHDSFTLVAKIITVRMIIASTVNKPWHIYQIDINNAFLHGKLEKDIYLNPP